MNRKPNARLDKSQDRLGSSVARFHMLDDVRVALEVNALQRLLKRVLPSKQIILAIYMMSATVWL
jgi:hypothetical protein